VACDATSLGVMDLQCDLWPDLYTFDVEEVDVMGCYVEDSEEQHSVSNLSMEPLGLVKWQYANLGAEPSEDVSAHRHDNDHCVN
jgi:hypothetical protein